MSTLKKRVIVFGTDGARILINPEEGSYNAANSLVDPDLSEVQHLSPHKWALKDGKVVRADEKEIKRRESILVKQVQRITRRKVPYLEYSILLSIAVIVDLILRHFL